MSQNNIHTVAPTKNHTHTIILLHGRDSTALEFADEFFESQASNDLTLPEIFPTYKWIFPTSKLRNSARFETPLSQWFDIWSIENPSEKNEIQIEGLRESISFILDVKTEESFVPLENIILGGISQGCATAIVALLYSGMRISGFMGFCSWFPFRERIVGNKNPIEEIRSLFGSSSSTLTSDTSTARSGESVLKVPVFLSHSKDDEVVPIRNGGELAEGLINLGMVVTWNKYEDGGHWVNEPQGVDDMIAFIQSIA